MNVVVCGSMHFSKEMVDLEKRLLTQGHEVYIPDFADEYAEQGSGDHRLNESAEMKIAHSLILGHFRKISECDAILVANYSKGEVRGYVGANTFLEIGFAHVLDKRIYMLYDVPDQEYIADELAAMKPVVIKGDLSRL